MIIGNKIKNSNQQWQKKFKQDKKCAENKEWVRSLLYTHTNIEDPAAHFKTRLNIFIRVSNHVYSYGSTQSNDIA